MERRRKYGWIKRGKTGEGKRRMEGGRRQGSVDSGNCEGRIFCYNMNTKDGNKRRKKDFTLKKNE